MPLQVIELVLLGLHRLVNLVILLSEPLEGSTDFLLLFSACLPLGDEVIRLEKGVPLHMRYFLFILLLVRHTVFDLEFLHDGSDIGGGSFVACVVVPLWVGQLGPVPVRSHS